MVSLKGIVNKFKENKQALDAMKNNEEESPIDSIKRKLLTIKIVISMGLFLLGAAGGVLMIILIIILAFLPIMAISSVVTNVVDSVKDFGASVGNLFTSGCYGSDEYCREQADFKAEDDFFDAMYKVYDNYNTNSEKAMDSRLYDANGNPDENNTTNDGYGRYRNYITINVPVLAASLLFAKEPTEGFYDFINNYNVIETSDSKLGSILGSNYIWYEDENDIRGINYDKLFTDNQISGITTDNPCGNYDEKMAEILNSAAKSDYLYYYTKPSGLGGVWNSVVDFFTDSDDYNQMRVMAKKLVSRNISSTCSVTENDDGTKVRNLSSTVSYGYNEEKFKDYLMKEYLPYILKQRYLKERMDYLLSQEGYYRLGGTIYKDDGTKLSKGEADKLIEKDEIKIPMEKEKKYVATESDKKGTAEYILSLSSYYDYILNDILAAQQSKVRVCSTLYVEDENKVKTSYPIDTYIAGLVTSLNKTYGKSVSDEIINAEAIIFRTYILSKTNYCKDTLKISDVPKNSPFVDNYVSPADDMIKKLLNSKGKILVDNSEDGKNSGELLYKGSEYKLEFSYTSESEQAKDRELDFNYLEYQNQFTTGFKQPYYLPNYNFTSPNEDDDKIYGIAIKRLVNIENALPASQKNYEQILLTYFAGIDVVVERSGGNLVGGLYTSSAPAHDENTTTADLIEMNGYDVSDVGNFSLYPKTSYTGQCAWYAQWRATEILYFSDRPDRVEATMSMRGTSSNGGGWYNAPDSKYFEKSTDYMDVRAGSILSWSGGTTRGSCINASYKDWEGKSHAGCGHVAIIEEVVDNGAAVVISHSASNNWSSGEYTSITYYYNRLTLGQVLHYRNGYYFNGYVYLLG